MFGVDDPATVAAVRAYVKLMRAQRSVVARLEPALTACALTLTQLGVLEAVLHLGPLTHRDLGRKLLTSPGNLTDVVDKLERRGLVERRVALHDRRSNAIRLTAAGTTLLRKLKRQVSQHEKRLLENFSEAERASFIALLRKVFPQHR